VGNESLGRELFEKIKEKKTRTNVISGANLKQAQDDYN